MNFTILNWNIGGAKFLEEKTRDRRKKTRSNINKALRTILEDRGMGPSPDVITLQEIVQYQEPTDKETKNLLDEIPGYNYFPFPLINTKIVSSKSKWNKVLKDSDWHPKTYFAQGNAFLIKNNSPHFPVWDLSNLDQLKPGTSKDHFIEIVHLDSGLYFGERNTEPRAALVAHFIYGSQDKIGKSKNYIKKPLDIFVVNLHLTTMMMEREGVPEIDALAAKVRQTQLDVVFNGIVSRYNSWRRGGYRLRGDLKNPEPHETFDRHSPVWIIAGDFNFTEESAEYAFIKRMNFIDTVPTTRKTTLYGHGTKASGVGNDPTMSLDYIFAGPKFVSFDPAIEEKGLQDNRVMHDHKIRASDHYPILSSMTLIPS